MPLAWVAAFHWHKSIARNGPLSQQAHIFKRWEELANYPLLETEAALEHLLGRLSEWLRCDDARWLAAICLLHLREDQDYARGWRSPNFRSLPRSR